MKHGMTPTKFVTTLLLLPLLASCSSDGGGGLGGISLQARATGATTIRLSWSEPGNGISVSQYVVARNDDRSGSRIGDTSNRNYDVAGLAPGTRYCFEIRNPITANSMSNTACATTDPDTEAPTTPGGVTATAISTAQIDIRWDGSIDDYFVAAYNIFRDGTLLFSVPGTVASDTSAAPDTEYCYSVSAVDTSGNESARSNANCATTPPDVADPTTPTGLTATYSTSGSQPMITLDWTASTDDGLVASYRIYRDGVFVADIPDTSYDDGRPVGRLEQLLHRECRRQRRQGVGPKRSRLPARGLAQCRTGPQLRH